MFEIKMFGKFSLDIITVAEKIFLKCQIKPKLVKVYFRGQNK
jgi:hypothetical protein